MITSLFVFLVFGLMVSAGVMTLFAIFLRKLRVPTHVRRAWFIVVGSLVASPSLSPAGTLAMLPLPLGLMLAFTRSVFDLRFLVSTWWFFVPSLAVTASACWYIARSVFPNNSLKADGLAGA